MTVTLDLNPELEQGPLAQASARGVSLVDYLQEIVGRQAGVVAAAETASELPVPHLGMMGAPHRRDIYNNAR